MRGGISERFGNGTAVLLPVSGDDPRSLAELADYYRTLLDRGVADLGDLAYTAGALRPHGRRRRAQVVTDVPQAQDWLAGLDSDNTGEHGDPGAVALVFSGQGNQWPGMGRGLYASEPVARDVLDECDDLLRDISGWSLLEVLAAPSPDDRIGDPAVLQPVLVALQVAVSRQLVHWGLNAGAYVGHSLGEIAAAAAAGALPLADALRLAGLRGALMRSDGGTGRTALLGVPAGEAADRIAAAGGDAEIAGWNGPLSTLVAGSEQAVAELVRQLSAEDHFARMLPGDIAFHSSRMDATAAKLGRQAEFLRPRAIGALFVSTVTGTEIPATALDAAYWASNVARPVMFRQAVDELAARGYRTFVEVGLHPTLTPSLIDCLTRSARPVADPLVVPTLRRDGDERADLLTTAGLLYEAGYALDFSALAVPGRRAVSLDPPAASRPVPAERASGLRLWQAAPARRAEPGRLAWQGTPLASFALAARTAIGALVPAGDSPRITVRLEVGARLTAPDESYVAVPTGEKTVDVRLGAAGTWTTQATAQLDDGTGGCDRMDVAALRERCGPDRAADTAYGHLAALGLTSRSRPAGRMADGPHGELLIDLSPAPAGTVRSLLDVMLHGAVLAAASPHQVFLPFECVALHAPRDTERIPARWLHLGRPETRDDDLLARPALVLAEDGRVLAEAGRLVLQPVTADVLAELARQETTATGSAGDDSALAALGAMDDVDRVRAVTEMLRTAVARVLRIPSGRVDTTRALNHLGIDSIMGLELQRRLEADLHTEIKVVQLLRGDTIDDLAVDLSRRVGRTGLPEPGPGLPDLDDPRAVERLLATMDDLSGDDVDALLQRLAETSGDPS
ncbi:acyltransferase domain-containing protein [Dactylosporangium sp. NPDC000555]|uniref:acyltransferase domain-containing protein n=1 Tax=Dactylosporangium sp. NPDC000555 TaxID=3154260 RepID=UPI0033175818